MFGCSVGADEPGSLNRVVKAAANPGCSDSGAAQGEQEVCGAAGARMRQCPLGTPFAHPLVQGGQGRVIERDHALGVELAQRDLEPGAVTGKVLEAVEFEVE
ncbi:hypothetical protein AHiyo8_02900 [Arthrobacter sp. Hiyo8]|nr:hypothetical protein AHiyo8_02900 [Arthrobacter sp. Hiyo8]